MISKSILAFALAIILLTILKSCKTESKQERKIILNLTDSAFNKFKGKKLYLGYNRQLIDSVEVKQKKLMLHPINNKINYANMYSVRYWDEKDGFHYLRPIGFPSPYTKKRIVFSAFLMEDHDIEIVVDEMDVLLNASFKGSQRNEPYFKQVLLSYSTMDAEKERAVVIKNNMEIIKRYPQSAYLLNQLYANRVNFTVEELKKQLKKFIHCKETKFLLQHIEAYYPYAGSINSIFPEGLDLPNSNGNLTQLNTGNNYQLIVFWASWCAPCRAEIPELKQIYSKYGQKHMQMNSISIDGNADDWKSALEKEAMPWQQLIANDSYLKKLEQYFTVSQVPMAYLFNENGNLVRAFEGYPNNMLPVLDSIFGNLKLKQFDK